MVPRTIRVVALAVLVAAGIAAAPAPARADGFGIGLFLIEPTGVTFKIDLQRTSAIEILLGVTRLQENNTKYGHLTYLITPFAARGRSVNVPFRLGIGAALYDDVAFAVRAPFEIAFQFRGPPLELYGELAVKVTFVDSCDQCDDVYADLDGGIGFRIYL